MSESIFVVVFKIFLGSKYALNRTKGGKKEAELASNIRIRLARFLGLEAA